MAKYFVKKGIQLIIVTILISFFSFAVIYAAPGDISGMYLNEQMSDEEKEAIRENLGLNKSMPEQYWGWAKEVLKGDFGISLANHTFLYWYVDSVFLAWNGADYCVCSKASYSSVIGDAFSGK